MERLRELSESVHGMPWKWLTLLLVIGMVASDRTLAEDWPQWLGPNRDSVWSREGIVRELDPAQPPAVLWRIPVDGGYAGPAVKGNRLVVTDFVTDGDRTPNPDQRNRLDGTERVHCVDARTGETLWKQEFPVHYEISFPAGPRATPTIDGDRVYVLGAEGDLRCLNMDNGTVIWAHNFQKSFQAQTPPWGYCCHPLVEGERLFCIVGGPGSVAVAFDKVNGKVLWKAMDAAEPGYSAPTLVEAGGTRQLLIWHPESINGLNPETGEVYWSEPLDPNYRMSIVTPRVSNDLVFVGGIVNKSLMLSLNASQPTVSVQWYGAKDVGIDPVHSTPYVEDGYLYGVNRQGQLCCVEMASGSHRWSTFDLMPERRGAQSGTAFIVKNRDRFFIFNDSGELVCARMDPEAYTEFGRVKILETSTEGMGRKVVWSHPAYAHQCMFARNDQELVCVSLASDGK